MSVRDQVCASPSCGKPWDDPVHRPVGPNPCQPPRDKRDIDYADTLHRIVDGAHSGYVTGIERHDLAVLTTLAARLRSGS